MKIENARVRGWHLSDHGRRTERTYRFRGVQEAIAFVRDIEEVTHRDGRHPKISFGWRYVTVSLPAKSIKGSRAADVMTTKIDQVAQEMVGHASA